MKSIGIVGLRHSGKTTLARALLKVESRYVKVALADPLKDSAVEMCNTFLALHGKDGITRAELEHDKAQFRPFLMWLGTEFAREYIGPDEFWVNIFRKRVKEVEAEGRFVICDDVRFPNEAKRLRELGFLIVKVEREEKARQASLLSAGERESSHASETNVDLIDADVYLHEIPHAKLGHAVSFLLESEVRVNRPTYPLVIWDNGGHGLAVSAKEAA